FGFVSGLQTQGYKACFTCGPSFEDMAKYSSHLCKIVYLGHTKFLPLGHDMRSDPLLFSSFDMPYGDERDIPEATTFAYWRDVANRVIDPNDSMLYGEKDSNFNREACEDFERHPDVWITVDPNTGIEQRPSAPWTLTTHERRDFRNRIREMRFPT
ncbi:unnamed protein product, partial [Sphagnum jensenii]